MYPKTAATYLAGGFKAGDSNSIETKLRIYDIHFIYYGIPQVLPDKSSLSSCTSKNGISDPRECALSTGNSAQAYAGDPINARTGNFDYSLTDLALQTIAGPLTFQRSYASQATGIYTGTTNLLGPGWTHNQDSRLIFEPGAVWFKAHTANQYKFIDHGSHAYTAYPGVLASLTYSSTLGTYSLKTSGQSTYTFDSLGKLSQWRNELGYGYDYTYQNGKLYRVTEPLSGRFLEFSYVNDHLDTVADNTGREVSFAYDANGDLTSFTDVMEKSWRYEYDANQLENVLDGETLLANYVYTDTGRLDTLTLANGVTSSYGYDLSGQLTSLAHQNQQGQIAAYAYQYDLAGNRVQIQESLANPDNMKLPLVMAEGEESEGLLAMGAEMSYPAPGENSSERENQSSLAESVYPAPQEALPGAERLENTPPPPADGYPAPVENETGSIGSFWRSVVNFFARLFTFRAGSASANEPFIPSDKPVNSAQTLLESSQTYSVTIEYDYDPLNRLTGATYSSGEVYTYTYDKVGNRLSLISPEGATSYEYDEADRLVRVDDIDYTWDDNGSLLSDGVYTYTYDYENRLTAISGQPSVFSFVYNGLGDRYQQTVNGETVTYTLDIASDLSQVLMDGNYTYLYGLGRLAQQNESRTDYFLTDALGSVRQLTTQDGNVSLAQSFDPFGNPFSAMRPGASHYGYAGEWTDASGLQLLRARYYAPGQGRFVTHDPFPGLPGQPATLNAYVYALNNPLLYTDPSGEFVFLPLLAVALAGGVIGGLGYYAIQTYLTGDPCARWNWSEAALWGGAGAVIGAVMGVGIYGGWWVGVQLGWWGYGNLTVAGTYGVRSYNQLKSMAGGTSFRVHHLVEQRLQYILNRGKTDLWPSVVLTQEEHQIFTNAWRATIGYVNSNLPITTANVTLEGIWGASQDIYANYPALLAAVQRFLFR